MCQLLELIVRYHTNDVVHRDEAGCYVIKGNVNFKLMGGVLRLERCCTMDKAENHVLGFA